MKKIFLVVIIMFVFCICKAQQTFWTPGVPPGSTSFNWSVRFLGTDSLANLYFSNGNKWWQAYTAAQANLRFLQKADSTANGGYATNWKLKKYVPWSYIHTDSQQINIGDSVTDNAVLLQLNPIAHNGTLSAGNLGTGAGSQYYFGSDELSFNYFDGTYNQSISMPGGMQPITINNDNNRGIAYGVHPVFYDPLQVVDKKYADSIANADTAAIFHNNNQWYGNNTYHGTTIQILGGNLTLTKISTGTGLVSADGVSTNYLSLTGSSQGYIDLNGATDPNQHWEIGRGPTQGFSFESALGLWNYKFDNSTGNWNLTGGSLGASTVRTLDTRDIPSGGFIGPSDTTVFARSRTAADSNKAMFLDLNGKASYSRYFQYRQGVNADLTPFNRLQLGYSTNANMNSFEAGLKIFGREDRVLPRVMVIGYGTGLSREKATIAMETTGGTVDAPTALLSGTISGQVYTGGHDGVSAFREGGSLVWIAASDFSPTNAATDLHIKQSNTGSVTPLDVMVIGHDGVVSVPALTANRAIITNSLHGFAVSTTTDVELARVSGLTSPIQPQVDAKFPIAGGTITGNSSITASNGSGLSFTVNNTNATGLGAGYYSITPFASWYTGLLGSAAATNYTIYDVTHSAARLTVSNAGVVAIPALGISNGILYGTAAGVISETSQGAINTVFQGNGSAPPFFAAVSTAAIAANAVTLAKLATQANNTILGNNSGSTAVPSALTATQVSTLIATSVPQLITGTPTIVAGTGAGTGPTVSVSTNGKQLQVTVTTGTLPTGTNATIATVTLANALSYTPYPVFNAASGNTALLSGASMIYMTSTGTANVTITSGATALTAATTYIWNIAL